MVEDSDHDDDGSGIVDDIIDAAREAGHTPVTPTFERVDGREPADPPTDLHGFVSLKSLPEGRLREMGLQPWGDHGLWLFPAEWADAIPGDLEVVDIFGGRLRWSEHEGEPDVRFGALSVGIVPLFEGVHDPRRGRGREDGGVGRMTSGERGLYGKYEVYRDGEYVPECFVLRPETDEAARRAIETYIEWTDNETLAQDLREWLDMVEMRDHTRRDDDG